MVAPTGLPGQMVDQALGLHDSGLLQRSVTLTNLVTTAGGILNAIDGRPRSLSKADYLDFSGVCNFLASTTGLPAAQALRAIST
jgi:hypothetical protein